MDLRRLIEVDICGKKEPYSGKKKLELLRNSLATSFRGFIYLGWAEYRLSEGLDPLNEVEPVMFKKSPQPART